MGAIGRIWQAVFGLVVLLGLVALAMPAAASCFAVAKGPSLQPSNRSVPTQRAERAGLLQQVSLQRAGAEDVVALTYLGHSSFLIRSPEKVSAITDYNGYIRSRTPPDIVTMNHAHETHYTEIIEPGVTHVLRGWDAGEGVPRHNVFVRDMRVRNVPTNIRDVYTGTEFAGNSIFLFEAAGLCIAHLGHLHHQLQPEHIAQIGIVDVLLAPIDDGWTMAQTGMADVIDALRPGVVVPMHFNGPWLLDSFAVLMQERGYAIRMHDSPTIALSRATLPRKTVLVLPAGQF